MTAKNKIKITCPCCQVVITVVGDEVIAYERKVFDRQPKRAAEEIDLDSSDLTLDSDDSSDVDEALEQCQSIFDMCDQMPDRGEEFADSVRDKTESIRESIEKLGRVTPGQKTALDNMQEGLSRWIDR